MRTLGRLVLLTLLAIPAARAGDAEAKALRDKASKAWSDGKDQAEVLKLFDEALAAKPTDRAILYSTLLMKGQYLQAIVSDLPAAEVVYTKIITELAGLEESETVLRMLKSEAMAAKAVLVYAAREDAEQAVSLFKGALMNWTKSSICDRGSQFLFRLGRDATKRDAGKRKELMDISLKSAQEAVQFIAKEQPQADKAAPALARYQLQLAVVQLALGQEEEARKTRAAIDQAQLGAQPGTLYQQALWHVLSGDADAATAALKEFMVKTRPSGPAGVKSRNQLRKFIRGEPDFKPLFAREDWKELTVDEPEEKPGK